MATPKHLSTIKRFGARYGRRVKERFASVERSQRSKHKCPYCNKVAARFKAVGIWECKNCKSRFTGKAFSPTKKIITKIEKAVVAVQKAD
jgi:large subunit ribosomal protein L37Ae